MVFASGKLVIILIIAIIFSLVVLIITGKILYGINKSSCDKTKDIYLKESHTWAAWGVGISTVALILSLVGIIAIFIK